VLNRLAASNRALTIKTGASASTSYHRNFSLTGVNIMRNPLVHSLLGTALIAVGAVNAHAANGNFYDPSLDNMGLAAAKSEAMYSPDALAVQSIEGHQLNRTIGCPGRGLLDKGCGIEDADKDTVEDWADKCPNTPSGMKVNALGCEIDTDGDGVLDSVDKCPTVYAKTPDGCPPEAVVNEGVVPAPASAPAVVMTLGDVNFAFDSATLTPAADANIDKAVAHVNQWPDEKFELKGNTDSIGSDAYNMKLSQRRADAVRNEMIKRGVAADRITATGYGEADPVSSNATKEGRAENRRVELFGRK
jgi:outer membrane protein OmpA-like peptidoglycan-associated protein